MKATRPHSDFDELLTRRPERIAASRAFGGTTIYAKSEEVIERAVNRLSAAFQTALQEHLILCRTSLAKVISDLTGQAIDRMIFGAVFGRQLCLGEVRTLVTITVNSRRFYGYFRADRLPAVEGHLATVEKLLREKRTLSVREVQSFLFPHREWGSWMCSCFLLGHLAFLGRATMMHKDLFAWPTEIEHAVVSSNR